MMKNENKTREQLLKEISNLNKKVAELEKSGSKHKQAEKANKESEDKFTSIFKSKLIGILFWNAEGDISDANEAFLDIVGYTKDEILKKNVRWKDMTPPEYLERDEKLLNELATQGYISPIEKEYFHKDGHRIPIIIGAATLPGSQINGVAYVLDVTERKLAEEMLKESEERYKGIIQSTASCIAVYKPIDKGKDFIFVDFNSMAEKVENISKEKVIGKKVSDVFPGVIEFGLFKVFQNVWKSGKPEHFPVSIYQDDRIQGYRENYIYKLSSGEIVAVYQDLTDRKQAENEVTSSKARLEHLLAKSSAVIYSSSAKEPFGAIYISENVRDIIGSEPGDFLEDPGFWASRIHPDDSARVFRELANIFEVGYHNHEYRWKKKDGGYIWIYDEIRLVYDKKGAPIEMVGTWLDITERKQAVEELQKHRKHLEELVKERTEKLEEKNIELDKQMKVFVGRELKIRDLEKRIRALTGKE